LFAVSLLSDLFNPAAAKLFLFWLLAIALVTGSRAVARAFCRRRIEYLQNTIIIGAGEVGQSIAKKLISHTEYGINLVGFVDAQPKARLEGLAHLTVLGELSEISELVKLLDVERVIVAFSNDDNEDLLDAVGELRQLDVQVDIVPRLFDRLGPSVSIHTIEGIPLVGLPPSSLPASSRLIKRALDVVVAGAALLLFAPIFVVIAVMIRCDSRGPVFYRHVRVGRRGTEFNLFKFRSMHRRFCRGEQYGGQEAEAEFARLMSDPQLRQEFAKAYKLVDDPRVTSLGRWLRRTSIDELPQLLNVLKGDMSLVGPRPLTQDELLEYYGNATSELLQIRPGITGYWQINGRSDLEYDDRVRLDMAYVGGWTLGLDLRILAKTVGVLAGSRGAV
jgi:exopolysaccharide biosynthesis polyprenyl glycosylphosphotransferase